MKDLPARPAHFSVHFDGKDPMPEKIRPEGSPENFERVCSVEWSWSPSNERIDAYNLSSHGNYWVLWVTTIEYVEYYIDEDEEEESDWVRDFDKPPRNEKLIWNIYSYGLNTEVDALTAATYLLMDAWSTEFKMHNLDHFHDFLNFGLLSADQVSAIADKVWLQKENEKTVPQ